MPDPVPPMTFESLWERTAREGGCPLAEVQDLLYAKLCGGRGACENYERARLPPIPF